MRLVFATHEIALRGHSLRRIETAMQRMELSMLTALPGKQRSLIPDGIVGQETVIHLSLAVPDGWRPRLAAATP